ncbi:MAG: acetyl-CoA carboxylase biotin carboxyl carrier protein subunit, partial [Candidatus Izimaplasma sp.]|nr:acetyl-CoA carboxylase biotin carboxyl carrier protein subunit [Candidatus Izimaplasma bacterium]
KENNNFLKPSNQPSSSSIKKTFIEEDNKEGIIENENYLIKAPLVGIFYCAPSPDSEPFVRVNQKVNKGDVLFIVEAMKVMNEITSPVSGTIAKINVKDATMVEFDQVVMEIKE